MGNVPKLDSTQPMTKIGQKQISKNDIGFSVL